jgi:pimeloyl-ACP methyl ester carboxylesterase
MVGNVKTGVRLSAPAAPPRRKGHDAVRLVTHRWGNGDRRALLLHGLTSCGATWWRVAEALARDGMAVYAPDLRGHGRSPKPGSYTAAEYAADLSTLPSGDWELVVGHSLGGVVALQAVTAGDVRTRRLLLLDPVLELTERERELLTATCIAEVVDGRTVNAVRAEHPEWHPLDVHLKARAARHTSVEVVRKTLAQNRPWDFRQLALGVACPTTILGAEPALGALMAPALGRELSSLRQELDYRRVRGAGHSIHRDQPDVAIDAARALIDRTAA